METGSEIDALRKEWCKRLKLSDDSLNHMLVKALGKILTSFANENHGGNFGELIREQYYDEGSPSEKTLRLLSQSKYNKRQNGTLSTITGAMIQRVLKPLDICFQQLLDDYLIECEVNQAAKELPNDFVARDTILDTIVESLLPGSQGRQEEIWLTSTLSGTGGVGKSVLAAAAGCDPRIQSHFFNGILWLEAGDNDLGALNARANSMSKYLEKCWDISADKQKIIEVSEEWDPNEYRKQGLRALARTIENRYVLLILDDAWDGQAVAWLTECLRECSNTRLLITSRISKLAGQHAKNIPVNEMQVAESRQLLLSGFNKQEELAIYAEQMLLFTGCWPLLIKLAKGLIQISKDVTQSDSSAFKTVLKTLKTSGMAALNDTHSQLSAKHKNLGVVLNCSIQALSHHSEVNALLGNDDLFGFSITLCRDEQQNFKGAGGLFHSLVLFPEDSHVYAHMVAPLWRMEDVSVAQFFQLLLRFNLVDYCSHDEQGMHLRLHDEVSRYLQQKFSRYAQPLHDKWCEVFAAPELLQEDLRHTIRDGKSERVLSEYFWQRHGYHLIQAERWIELASWLTTPAYLAVRSYFLGSTQSIESDVWRCLEKSYAMPKLMSFSEELTHLHKYLPHICHWPLDFNLKDWLSNLQAYLPDAFTTPNTIGGFWQLHQGWESWLLSPSNLVRTLTPHYDSVLDVVELDSDYIVTCADDNSIRVFNAINGQMIQLINLKDTIANCLSAVGKGFYAAGTAKGELKIWYVHDDEARYSTQIGDSEEIVWCQNVTESIIALLTAGGKFFHLNAFANTPPKQLAGEYGKINCCIGEMQKIWAATHSGEILLIEPESNQVQIRFSSVNAVSFLEYRDHYLLVGNAEGQAEVWDTTSGLKVYHVKEETWDSQWACLLPGKRLFVLTEKNVKLINLVDQSERAWQNYYSFYGNNLIYWSDDLVVYPTSYDTIVAFDVEQGLTDHTFNPHSIPLSCLNIIKGQLFTGCHQGNMSLWRASPEDTRRLSGNVSPSISQIIVMPNSEILTASAQGGQIIRWQLDGQKQEIDGPELEVDGEMDTLGFSSIGVFDTGEVLSVIHDKRWIIWDTIKEVIVKSVNAPIDLSHYPDVHFLDGYILATKYDDNSILLIDCYEGEILCRYDGHKDLVNFVTKLSDGRIISASWDNSIHIWSINNDALNIRLEGHESAVMHVTELPGGLVLSVSNDGTAKIWDVGTQKVIKTIKPDANEAGSFALGRVARLDCGVYLLAGLNRMIYIYDMNWSQKAKIKMRSDIETITTYGDNNFFVGQKDGNLVMFDVADDHSSDVD